MGEGGPIQIGISRRVLSQVSEHGMQPGAYVVVSVRDTGHGMDESTMRKAIEPFYTTKDLGKGTGLGLSMVHGMAAQSGGGLVLESVVGVGTTASIWLPVVDGETASHTVISAPEIVSVERPLRILVVDDEPLVRHSVVSMLEGVGHEVEEAECGAQALQKVREGGLFDIVVTDHLMPGMTGLEMIAELRELDPAAKALLVTGYAQMENDPSVPRLGKPFSAADLARAVEEASRSDNVLRMRSRRTA
jgi:CheY-like chemotaxis protein